MESRRKVLWGVRAVAAALGAIYLAAFAVKTLGYGGRYTPDSVVYVDVARNLCAGHGISSALAPLDYALANDLAQPTPMTMWAPLYPCLIAALFKAGMPVAAAALAVPIACLGIALIMAFLLTRALYDEGTALLAVAMLISFNPLYTVATHAWSETLAIAALMAALYAAVRSRPAGANALWPLFSGLAAGTAIAARYAMLPLAAVACMGLVDARDRKRSVFRVAVFAVALGCVVGPVFARNLWWSGHPFGMHLAGAGVPLSSVAEDVARVALESARPHYVLGETALRLLIACALVRCVLDLRSRTLARRLRESFIANGRYLPILWPALYLALLVQSQLRYAIDPVDERLFAPAGVALAVGIVAALASLSRIPAWLASASALVLIGLTCLDEGATAAAVHRSRLPKVYDYQAKLGRSEGMAWLAKHVSEDDVVITESGYRLPLYMGPFNVLYFEPQLPPASPVAYSDLCDYLTRHLDEHACAYVDLRKGDRAAPEKRWGPFFDDLAAGRVSAYPGVTLEADLDDAIIYRITPAR